MSTQESGLKMTEQGEQREVVKGIRAGGHGSNSCYSA